MGDDLIIKRQGIGMHWLEVIFLAKGEREGWIDSQPPRGCEVSLYSFLSLTPFQN